MTELDPFIPALKIRIARSEATFDLSAAPTGISGAGRHPTVVMVSNPRVVLGRGDDAALPLVGSDAKDVSRAHLLLRVDGGRWTFADLGSTNGTRHQVVDGDGKLAWRQVGGLPLPMADGTVLLMADAILLSFGFEQRAGLQGDTTDRKQDAGRIYSQWIDDPKLEEAAAALLRHRRTGHPGRGAATVAEMADWLGFSPETIYRRLRKLRALAPIEALWHEHPDNLADLLEETYPYLLAPREGDPPRQGDDTVTSAGG